MRALRTLCGCRPAGSRSRAALPVTCMATKESQQISGVVFEPFTGGWAAGRGEEGQGGCGGRGSVLQGCGASRPQ